MSKEFVRDPAVSGMFYPADPSDQASPEAIKGEIKGLISPHAGYVYSGAVAAWAYKTLAGGAYDTVIILAPSHRSHFKGVAVQEKGSYRMPLGTIDVDEEFASRLLNESPVVRSNRLPHQGEHSLEVQIPFLQVVLKDFRIVPLIMGEQDFSICESLASALYRLTQSDTKTCIMIGSTDLSHYYPYSYAVELDGRVARNLQNFDERGLAQDLAAAKCEACGAGPMITTMLWSQKMGADAGKVLKYANSGDVSGDKSSVVGYISAVFYRRMDSGHAQ